MEDIEIVDISRELTVPENLVKLVVGTVVGFLAKKIVEDAIEAGFRHRRP